MVSLIGLVFSINLLAIAVRACQSCDCNCWNAIYELYERNDFKCQNCYELQIISYLH